MSRSRAQLGGADASERRCAVRVAVECRQVSHTERVASATLSAVPGAGLGIGHHLSIPERLDHGQNAPLSPHRLLSSAVLPSLSPFLSPFPGG